MRGPVVVAGGGLVGLSVAYHLARRGARVRLFERECIGCHSATRMSMGLVTSPTFWPDVPTQQVAQKSMELYTQLAEKGNFRFNRCGRVYLAHTRAAELHARRIHSRLLAYGHESEIVDDPSEMLARWPMLNTEDIKIAVISPDDVVLDSLGLTTELAEAAKALGVEIHEDCNVQKVLIGEGNAVYAAETDDGLVETKAFVSASGLWSNMLPVKDLYDRYVKRIPAHPCTYTFLTTGRLPQDGVSDQTPLFVDLDNGTYVCPSTFGTICGGFVEADIGALSLPHDAVSDWHVPLPDWDRFHSVLTRLLDRCPSLKNVPHGDLVSTAEMYTPDMYPIIGEPDQLRGYYLANGFNGHGLSLAGGMGDVLAQWVLEGHSDIDVSRYDVTRFIPLHTNPQYLFERTPEVASNTFNALHYSHQAHTARNLRMSPIYQQLRDAGAVFGEIMGYERPLWFGQNKEKGRNANYSGQDCLVGLPEWFPSVAKEYEACRERVGLIDMTSFSKFEVKGPDVVPFLQKVCSANIDKPIGTTIYTGMQDERGGYVTDCTLSRLSDNHYFIVAPTVQQVRCPAWLNKWISEWNVKVNVQDVTSLYTAMNIVGPASRYLMQDISGRQMASHEFPTFACRELNIGMAAGIRAVSVTHCGELGWVLYCPNEVAQNVYEQLVEAGKQYSMSNAGYYTLRHLRIEKFYVYWGQDINASVSPVECGRAFRVDFDKDFIGKDALLKQMERGVTKRFVQLLVDNHKKEEDPWPQGNEVIYRNGKPSGWTTSAAYGFTLRCHVCIGYLEDFNFGVSPEFINSGNYEIDIAGKRFPVRVNLHSPSLPMVSSEHPTHYRPTQ